MAKNNKVKSVLRNFAIIQVFSFQDNLKYLDPSYKMDLDLWDCFGSRSILMRWVLVFGIVLEGNNCVL